MKAYVRPTMQVVDLRVEERISGSGCGNGGYGNIPGNYDGSCHRQTARNGAM